MALEFKAPENIILKPIITVFGVGGAGGNAVGNMIKANLQGANFVVANTDAQALKYSDCANKIQLGVAATKGLGAGASPEVGSASAEESEQEIRSFLEGSNMVFITAGMGGGTGTGASPVIAKIAKELGILTVGVVTKPFAFEGFKRMKTAEGGLAELQKYVDTLIIIPNQNLFRIVNAETTFADAFKIADEVLHSGVRGITDLITMPGLINLDFADIKTVMSEKGKAMMGTGEASGEDRAIRAAEDAIANPLLDHGSMSGASGVLINITGGKDMTLYEVDSAANRIREEVGDSEANIIFGSTFNPDLNGTIRVSVVATGIEASSMGYLKENNTKAQQGSDAINFDLEEPYEIPSFNEYSEISNDEEQEIQHKLSEAAINWAEDGGNNQPEVKSDFAPRSPHKILPKQSLFKRMWNSLKSSDNTENELMHEEQSLDIDRKKKEVVLNSTLNNSSDIQDTPTFFRKK
jgi:cell division protein FtsZ